MKSLRDEIRLRRDKRTDLISSEALAEDFIRASLGFHRATHDFIESPPISNTPLQPPRFYDILITEITLKGEAIC